MAQNEEESGIRMDVPPIDLKITGYLATRQCEKVGDKLLPGEYRYDLIVSLPSGVEQLLRVPSEFFDSYLAELESAQAITPSSPVAPVSKTPS